MKAFAVIALLASGFIGSISALAQSAPQQTDSTAAPSRGAATVQPKEKTKAERREAHRRLHAVQRRKIK